MTILRRLKNYLSTKAYNKYRKQPCPKCSVLLKKFNSEQKRSWKYMFTGFVEKGTKGTLIARICGSCGYKDTRAYFVSDEAKLHNNFTFKVEK